MADSVEEYKHIDAFEVASMRGDARTVAQVAIRTRAKAEALYDEAMSLIVDADSLDRAARAMHKNEP